MAEPRNLFYYPRSPSAWLERTAGLSPLARAAWADLEGQAWTAPKRGAVPCSLPDDDATLARMARLELREWRKVSAEVRGLLMYRDGVLVDEVLLKTWNGQQVAYTKRVHAANEGNKAKALRKQSGRNADAMRAQSELELEGEALPDPKGSGVVPSPASGDALAPEGAALPAATSGTGDYLDRPSVREELLKRGVRPAEGVPIAPDVAEHHSAMMARGIRDAAHYAVVKDAAWRWMRAHPAETKALGRVVRPQNNLPLDEPLTGLKAEVLERAMVAEISAQQGWPSADEWDGEPLELRPIPQEAPC